MVETENKVTILYGQEKKEIIVSEKEYSGFRVQNENTLWEQVEKHEWISFDLFDTLLTRKVLLPEDIFDLVTARTRKDEVQIPDFKEKRISAQGKLGLTNPDIYEIYDEVIKSCNISGNTAERLMELEISLEEELLIPRDDMVKLFKKCKKMGKHISIVTDMYLPKNVIEKLLDKNGITGYENLYLSCDRKQLKLQGLLETYKKETEGDNTSYLHIGDNWINDGVCAKQAGIDFVLIKSGYEQAIDSELRKAVKLSKTLEEHILLGLVIAKICNSPFVLVNDQFMVRDNYSYGYAFCAPLINQYVIWLCETVKREHYDDVLFAARDGYLIQKMYSYYAEKNKLQVPYGVYFYTSRKAAVMTTLDNEAAINMVIRISQEQGPEWMMKNCFGLPEEKILPYNEKTYNGEIHKYVWEHKEAILERTAEARNNYFKYIGNCGLQIGKKYAFMDFVSSGTSQKALQRSMPFELCGTYAGWNGTDNQEAYNIKSLFSDHKFYFMQTYKRMETFLTSEEPSLFCMDENGKPVFEQQSRSDEEEKYIKDMQNACLDFQNQFLNIIEPQEKNISVDFTDAIFAASQSAHICNVHSFLNHMVLIDDWNGKENFVQEDIKNIQGESEINDNKELGELITTHSGADYSDILKEAEWETFYNCSVMREGILNWYPFKKKGNLLEVSCGYGGITGLLARNAENLTVVENSEYRAECIRKRYANLKNLVVKTGGVAYAARNEYYDYIVVEKAIDTKDELLQLLHSLIPLLKKDGRLLFVCNNGMGAKYWCGVPDSVTGSPFAGIRNLKNEKRITRNLLIQELEKYKKINSWNMYYPFPDEKLPQAIYTDRYLPKKSIRDRVIPYYTQEQRQSLVCAENDIYDELIANGVLPVFANSFLVECSKEELIPEIKFAALSTDRGWKHGFATVIREDGTVQKKILHPDGKENLKKIYENALELQKYGVLCIEQKLKEDVLEMPYVKQPTCIELLKDLFERNASDVEHVFDKLWCDILKSSEHIPFENCALKDARIDKNNCGEVLKRAYIDMIPYNCFLTNGELYFYDQEFVKNNYPAKYVLFRALRYTYIYVANAENVIPLQYFKEKYQLEEVWQCFEEEEARFIEDNRNYELFSSFYRWAFVGEDEIDTNIERLTGEKKPVQEMEEQFEEKESNWATTRKKYGVDSYRKDYRLNAIKNVQLQLLDEFSRVCRENDLSYCAFYGTLLGTTRHKGYVPWDDDLDVAMPRTDFDKLLEIASDVFENPYFLQSSENDEGCFYGGYAKLRKSDTTGIESRNEGNVCNQGIWIDILPLDAVIEDEEKRRKQLQKIRYFQRLLMKQSYPNRRVLWDLSEEDEMHCLETSRLFTRKELCDGLHTAIIDGEKEISNKVAVLARYQGNVEYIQYSREDFEFLIKGSFEGRDIPIPVGYENVLKADYGEEYYFYPPISERKPHHMAVFDVSKSYVDYLDEHGYNR